MSDPFAPVQSSQPTGPALGAVPCSVCGTPIDPDAASYSEKGELVCKRCEAKETIEVGEQRAASGIVGGAIGALSLGLISMCFNPFLLTSFMAVGSGIGTIVTLTRHPEYKTKLGGKYPLVMGAAIIGILLGLAYPALMLLSMLGILAGAALR